MKLAIVRIRADLGLTKPVRDALQKLKLEKKNSCVVLEGTPEVKGALKKVRTIVTWGPADDKTSEMLKGKKTLHPPKKGFGKKGIKMPFKLGGAYGDRKEQINDLIMRMV